MKSFLILLLSFFGFKGTQAVLAPSTPQAKLTGTITAKGVPLQDASVRLSQGSIIAGGAVTNEKGSFEINVSPGKYTLEVSRIGYITYKNINVSLETGQTTTCNIAMSEGAALDEVIVTDRALPTVTPSKGAVKDGERSGPADEVYDKSGGELREKHAVAYDETLKRSVAAPVTKRSEMAVLKSKPKSAPSKPAEHAPEPMRVVTERVKTEEVAEMYEADDATYEEKKPGGGEHKSPRAGLLTAGEWNDLHNWSKHWVDLLADGEITGHQKTYGFYPSQRYTLLLANAQGVPVADAAVFLKNQKGETLWEARTDNTGKAELWANLFNATASAAENLRAEISVKGKKFDLESCKPGLNRLTLDVPCDAPRNVDIVWAVDATGSMGDEIEYLKTELLDVIGRAKGRNPDLSFRMGTVFYRDKGDEYLIKSSGLSFEISKTVDFIKKQFAGGGGDYPEAVHTALEEAIFNQKWNEHAIARICFLVLDASPHQTPEVNASLHKSIVEAARRGIRIVPISASGIQKDTEFLMKFFGLATNGTYVFLTDHSGIGGKHLEPTSDEYKVEPLNDLLVRLISEYSAIESCEGISMIRFENDPQQPEGAQWVAHYYPNPASDRFTLELPIAVQSVTLYDAEGRSVRSLEKPQQGANIVPVQDLAPGFYTIRILCNGRMQSGKLMIVRE